MTEEHFLNSVLELSQDVNDLIKEKALKLVKSGAINLYDFENDYLLPKLFICAVAKEIESQFQPPLGRFKPEIKNIRKFL